MSARSALELATLGGARVLQRPELGRLVVGCAADIVAYRVDDIAHAGGGTDPVASLVTCMPGQAYHSIINGNVVIHRGQLCYDVAPIWPEPATAMTTATGTPTMTSTASSASLSSGMMSSTSTSMSPTSSSSSAFPVHFTPPPTKQPGSPQSSSSSSKSKYASLALPHAAGAAAAAAVAATASAAASAANRLASSGEPVAPIDLLVARHSELARDMLIKCAAAPDPYAPVAETATD